MLVTNTPQKKNNERTLRTTQKKPRFSRSLFVTSRALVNATRQRFFRARAAPPDPFDLNEIRSSERVSIPLSHPRGRVHDVPRALIKLTPVSKELRGTKMAEPPGVYENTPRQFPALSARRFGTKMMAVGTKGAAAGRSTTLSEAHGPYERPQWNPRFL